VSDPVLAFLKFCLVAILYLFLARVVWIVARELRGTPAPAPAVPPPPAARSRKAKAWRLVLVEPKSEAGAVFTVEGETTLGRGGGCTVPLAFDTFVSQVHARAFDRDGALWVEDLGSRNGTYVNGQLVHEPTQVAKGARVQVGETVLEVDR
jgi:hypothetical protein